MACDPGHAAAALLQYTGRPLGESAHQELSYSWEAGSANVSGIATRLPGVSGRVALWSLTPRSRRSPGIRLTTSYGDILSKYSSVFCFIRNLRRKLDFYARLQVAR